MNFIPKAIYRVLRPNMGKSLLTLNYHHLYSSYPTSFAMETTKDSFTCSTCHLSFATRGARDSHRRKCKAVETITINNKVYSLILTDNKTYRCQCNSTECKGEYSTPGNLKKHLNKHQGIWQEVGYLLLSKYQLIF